MNAWKKLTVGGAVVLGFLLIASQKIGRANGFFWGGFNRILEGCGLKADSVNHPPSGSSGAGPKSDIIKNQDLTPNLFLKDQLKHIWSYQSRTWAGKALDHWCALARSLNHRALNKFAKMLERHRYGILNHCEYPIHTGKLEGVNNKIKVIKRKAYGYHDLRYFTLKIFQACYN